MSARERQPLYCTFCASPLEGIAVLTIPYRLPPRRKGRQERKADLHVPTCLSCRELDPVGLAERFEAESRK